MKKILTIITALIILLVSCPGPDNSDSPNNPNNPPKKTLIIFDNTEGICSAAVYSDFQRREEDKIAEIPSGDSSAEIEWVSGVLVPFYLSYTVSLKGADGFTINYIPREIGKDQVAAHIEAGATTRITIPKLDETVSSPDDLLSNYSYLLIKNNSSSSFQLQQGSGPIPPDNSSALTVNSGKEALYKINPGPASVYQLLAGTSYYAFPGSVTDFRAGRLYSFVFDGAVSFVTEIEIKLGNVVPDTGPGLYRGDTKIGRQNLAESIAYISANAVSGDNFSIVLGADESSAPVNLYYSGKNVGITLLGHGGERTITLSANGSLFTVNSGVTLTLDENIVLMGRSANNNSLVRINAGKLIINAGAKITGNTASGNSAYGGGVYMRDGILTMNGGEISGNTVSVPSSAYGFSGGGGVYIDYGTFMMNGGKISGNAALSAGSGNPSTGGGVDGYGTIIMSGGEISSNRVSSAYFSSGGGVAAYETFIMDGGEISGNTISAGGSETIGGGVFVADDADFTMSGGKITGNTAPGKGVGGGVGLSGTFTMDGGEISGNSANSGGGVYSLGISFTMTGGVISRNTASYSGGGVELSDGIFTKTGGTITGYSDDTVNGNVAKNTSGVVQNNRGHAVYVDFSVVKRRETTAGPGDNLNSDVNGAVGGWQ